MVARDREAELALRHLWVVLEIRIDLEEQGGCEAHTPLHGVFLTRLARENITRAWIKMMGHHYPTMANTPLQAKLKALMAEHQISARGWSLKAGLSETAIKSMFQSRSKNPRGDTLVSLAEAIGISPNVLLPSTPLSAEHIVASESGAADMTPFASTLVALLAERDINQTDLARSLGVTSQAVNQWTSGVTKPGLPRMQRLAVFLDVPLSKLIDLGPEPPPAADISRTASLLALRIAAVRRCVWPAIEQAAADLSIPLAQFEAVEAGTEQFTPAQLLRFCARAGCTECFIVQGDMDGVRWVLVAWLGHTAPELVPGLLEMAQQARAVSGEDDGEG